MAEKDANNKRCSESITESDAAQALPEENASARPILEEKEKSDSFDLDSYLPSFESNLKKEENPFSFKKFLNQDTKAQKNKGARKKVYTTNSSTTTKPDLPNHGLSPSHTDINSRMVNATDVSSVLPDFVQDHLVIEQCYLSGGSSTINIDNLNLQNLPDLNLEHRNVHFMLNSERDACHSGQSSNLPDFANFASDSSSKGIPDFAVINESDCSLRDRTGRMDMSNGNDASQMRQTAQISSSPSVPLDLPSYESNEPGKNSSIPFDLTIPAEEKSGNGRGISSTETVSKSLPDFLSDGPIKKELDENLQNVRSHARLQHNGLPPPEISSLRSDPERLHREIEYLRRQLSEKNRRIEILESELEHLHNTDQRETASLDFALQEVENNLKKTAKRALNAEEMVLKLKQENKLLKSEVASLKSENVELKIANFEPQASTSNEFKNNAVAKELRIAADRAEGSLRSLLRGVDNLRALAESMDRSRFNEEDF